MGALLPFDEGVSHARCDGMRKCPVMSTMQLSDRQAAAGASDDKGRRSVSLWLWLVACLVLAMVVVGGATRLTESGLSITEWQPILGAFPPLTDAAWMAAFEKYKQNPQ